MKTALVLFVVIILIVGCKKEVLDKPISGYPPEIEQLVQFSCAVSGCHNRTSRKAAAGLSMESWDDLFDGANNGNASVVPYSASQSPLFFFINTFEELGPALVPTMPYNRPKLSRQEVQLFVDWINHGALNSDGKPAFNTSDHYSKMYVINSLCNLVAVIDAQTGLVKKYLELGDDFGTYPEAIETSRDGNQVYVLSQSGQLASIDAELDRLQWKLDIGSGWWRSLKLFPNSKYAMVTDFAGNSAYGGGRISIIDLQEKAMISEISLPADSIYFPYGIEITKDNSTAFVSCYKGNFLYKIDLKDPLHPKTSTLLLNSSESIQYGTSQYKPGNLTISKNQDRLYVLCEGSHELRVLDVISGNLLGKVQLPSRPNELCLVEDEGFVFVSCTEDQTSSNRGKGAVYAIENSTYTIQNRIYTGYQPRGMVYEPQHNLLYVSNRNADLTGADQPHHYTDCEGNNGYLTAIDLNTMKRKLGYKAELSVEPFGIAIRK